LEQYANVIRSVKISQVSASLILQLNALNATGEILKIKLVKFSSICFTTKEGANTKNYDSTVIPKA